MQIAELWRYPIKSLGGERLQASDVTGLGLVGDRSWGIEDMATGKILTGRREAALLLAEGRLDADGSAEVHLDGDVLRTDDELSDWLGRPVRLRRADGDAGGTFDSLVDNLDEAHSGWKSWTGPAGAFHDSTRTRVSLIGYDTLCGEDPRRFRANVVLREHPGAAPVGGSIEDAWVGGSITVGIAGSSDTARPVVLDVRKQIDRCVMVTRPQPGLRRNLDVLKRVNAERDGLAAIGALVIRPGRIAVGDVVTTEDPGVR